MVVVQLKHLEIVPMFKFTLVLVQVDLQSLQKNKILSFFTTEIIVSPTLRETFFLWSFGKKKWIPFSIKYLWFIICTLVYSHVLKMFWEDEMKKIFQLEKFTPEFFKDKKPRHKNVNSLFSTHATVNYIKCKNNNLKLSLKI